jgi:hypothetical protein
MMQEKPEDDAPEGWYNTARIFDANWTANQAFHSVQRTPAPTLNARSTFPTPRAPFMTQPAALAPAPCASQYPGSRVPMRASNVPAPMDIDAAHRQNAIPMLCRYCGEPGHFARDCPKAYDVRYMTSDEREDWIEHILSGDTIRAIGRCGQGFYVLQWVNHTPPLSSRNTLKCQCVPPTSPPLWTLMQHAGRIPF